MAKRKAQIPTNGDQLHAGDNQRDKGKAVWHTGKDVGNTNNWGYWCGHWYYRTPEELLRECQTTIADLLRNHPELR